MLCSDIYLCIGEYLTPYETKQLAMTCQEASNLRHLMIDKIIIQMVDKMKKRFIKNWKPTFIV